MPPTGSHETAAAEPAPAKGGARDKTPKVRSRRGSAKAEPSKRPDLPQPRPVERPVVVGGQLGTKYTCHECGRKFYDLGKPDPACPKCGADPRDAPKPSRVRTPPPPEPEPEPEPEPPEKARPRLLDEDEEEVVIEDDDSDLDLGLEVVDSPEDFEDEEDEETS